MVSGERNVASGTGPRGRPPGRPATGRRPGALARLGLTGPRAEEVLTALGWWAGDQPAPAAENVMWALARSPDPDLALRAVDRLAGTDARQWKECEAVLRRDVVLRGRLFALLGGSTALGDHLVAHPDRWRRLTADAPDPAADVATRTATLLTAVGADPSAPPAGAEGGSAAGLRNGDAVHALRTAYRDEMLVLAAADLAAVSEPSLPVLPLEDVAAQLADLATAALRAALAVALAETDAAATSEPVGRLAVIAMGKTGGAELNYVSDVDVVFVAEPADATTTRLASRMMRIAGEACFPVDANLRPEGRQGALVRSLDGHVAYYKRWAKTWEFQALLKARPVAGDPELGKAYGEAVAPMVWTAAGRPDFVADVQAMRRRVEEHVRPDHADRELKLGRGGLRDVEFAVQLLQLVHGRADPALRSPTTLDALAALAGGGYVGRDDGANLAASYRFLRLLEHRLQLQRMRRTHLLPAEDDTDALRWLARAAKLRPDGRHDAVGVLLEEWRRNARRVRRLHEKLFYRPLLDAASRVSDDRAVAGGRHRPARGAGLGVARGRAAPPPGADRRGVAGRVDPEDAPAGAARRARPHPGPRPRTAGLPAGVRGARPHPLVPAAAARRGAGRGAAHVLARDVRAGPGPARARAGGAAAARRTGLRPQRRADPRPGERRRDPAHRGRPPARPTGRRDHRPLGPPPRAAPDRVRGPAGQDGRRAGLRRALRGLGRGPAGRARLGAARARRVDAARPARGDRHGPAGRRGAGLRQRRGRPVRLRAARRVRRTTRPSGSRRPWSRPSGASSAARARTRRW